MLAAMSLEGSRYEQFNYFDESFIPGKVVDHIGDIAVVSLVKTDPIIEQDTPTRPTARQIKLLEAMSYGYSNERIGSELGKAPRTIKNMKSGIFKILNAINSSHAIKLGFDNGFLEPTTFDSQMPFYVPPLTMMQSKVLNLAANGLTANESADSLGLATKTVKNYKYCIFSKLGANNMPAAVRRAIVLGFIPIQSDNIFKISENTSITYL